MAVPFRLSADGAVVYRGPSAIGIDDPCDPTRESLGFWLPDSSGDSRYSCHPRLFAISFSFYATIFPRRFYFSPRAIR